jgi:hypothetical protein
MGKRPAAKVRDRAEYRHHHVLEAANFVMFAEGDYAVGSGFRNRQVPLASHGPRQKLSPGLRPERASWRARGHSRLEKTRDGARRDVESKREF